MLSIHGGEDLINGSLEVGRNIWHEFGKLGVRVDQVGEGLLESGQEDVALHVGDLFSAQIKFDSEVNYQGFKVVDEGLRLESDRRIRVDRFGKIDHIIVTITTAAAVAATLTVTILALALSLGLLNGCFTNERLEIGVMTDEAFGVLSDHFGEGIDCGILGIFVISENL